MGVSSHGAGSSLSCRLTPVRFSWPAPITSAKSEGELIDRHFLSGERLTEASKASRGDIQQRLAAMLKGR